MESGDMYTVKDRVVVVTGAANGIGAQIVRAFLHAGVKHVAALDIDENNGRTLERELQLQYGFEKFRFLKCDIMTTEIEAAFDDVMHDTGYIDVVVNNAGIYSESPETYVREIDLNFKATVTSSLKAYNWMRRDRGGRGGTIINISSVGALSLLHILPIYNATKKAVLHFSCSLGMEQHYLRSKVRVMSICFGGTKTESVTKRVLQIDEETEKDVETFIRATYLQSPESAALGLVNICNMGASGSVWVVKDDKPPKNITEKINDSYKITESEIIN